MFTMFTETHFRYGVALDGLHLVDGAMRYPGGLGYGGARFSGVVPWCQIWHNGIFHRVLLERRQLPLSRLPLKQSLQQQRKEKPRMCRAWRS